MGGQRLVAGERQQRRPPGRRRRRRPTAGRASATRRWMIADRDPEHDARLRRAGPSRRPGSPGSPRRRGRAPRRSARAARPGGPGRGCACAASISLGLVRARPSRRSRRSASASPVRASCTSSSTRIDRASCAAPTSSMCRTLRRQPLGRPRRPRPATSELPDGLRRHRHAPVVAGRLEAAVGLLGVADRRLRQAAVLPYRRARRTGPAPARTGPGARSARSRVVQALLRVGLRRSRAAPTRARSCRGETSPGRSASSVRSARRASTASRRSGR